MSGLLGVTPKYDFSGVLTGASLSYAGDTAGRKFVAVFPAEDKQLQNVSIVSIIDDDESVRLAVKSLVRSLGLMACTFASAEEFLQSPHVSDTSCLITDVQLPGMNGLKLQSLVLAQGNDVPIIFVTAFPEERFQKRALEAGAVGFLSKPFDGQTLITLVEGTLKRGRDT